MNSAISDPGTLDIPLEWLLIAPNGMDRAEWADSIARELGLDSSEDSEFRRGLGIITEIADSLRPENRHTFVMLHGANKGTIRAMLSIQMLRVGPGAWDDYSAFHDTASQLAEVEFINRRVEERALTAGRALVIHEFTLRRGEGDSQYPAMERAVIGLFVNDSEAFVELTLITQDLALFGDMLEYLVDLASTYRRAAGVSR